MIVDEDTPEAGAAARQKETEDAALDRAVEAFAARLAAADDAGDTECPTCGAPGEWAECGECGCRAPVYECAVGSACPVALERGGGAWLCFACADERERNTDCPTCGGSGGGPDEPLYCRDCGGSGTRRRARDEED